MAITIPQELAGFLNELGYIWPEVDEDKLSEIGALWNGLGGDLQGHADDAHAHASAVWSGNRGQDIDAFQATWTQHEAPHAVLSDGATGAQILGVGLIVCAAIVLALKIYVIVQLTILLVEIIQAIITGPPTLGASLLEIPVFKKIADLALNFLFSKTMESLLA